jgi:Fe-S oxidoreductase
MNSLENEQFFEKSTLRDIEAKCTYEDLPACSAACPLHLDGRALSISIKTSDFAKAKEIVSNGLIFPNLVAKLCERPCEEACVRKQSGGAINLNALERVALATIGQVKPPRFKTRPKDAVIAVFGDDLACFAASAELAKKGYTVVHHSSLSDPLRILSEDWSIFEQLPVEFKFGQPVTKKSVLASLVDHPAVILGPRSNQWFNLKDPIYATTELEGLFSVQMTDRIIDALASARKLAISVDRHVQHVSLDNARENEGSYTTKLFATCENIPSSDRIAAKHQEYDQVEACAEASRCIECECLECIHACSFIAHYKRYPKKYAREIYNNLSIAMGMRTANEQINACSLCGQCASVCPYGFDLGEISQRAREIMVRSTKMPARPFEFALQDMDFSNSEEYHLVRHQMGFDQSKYAFFPGCQMGASLPGTLTQTYEDLTVRLDGGVGLDLGCCGIMARWAGQADRFQTEIMKLNQDWEALGKPTYIVACPTCLHTLLEHTLIPTIGIWDIYEEIGLPESTVKSDASFAVHDACGTRHDQATQLKIRRLLANMGYTLEQLPYNKETSACCGYGGLTSFSNREIADEMTEHLAGLSETPYVTYCVNCKDRLAQKGKENYHLLELIFGRSTQPLKDYSQRRINRIQLSRNLRKTIWKETIMDDFTSINLIISEEVKDLMHERMILKSDVIQVLENAKSSGQAIKNEVGSLLSSLRLGNVTFWVRYRIVDENYVIESAYSHRMDVEPLRGENR